MSYNIVLAKYDALISYPTKEGLDDFNNLCDRFLNSIIVDPSLTPERRTIYKNNLLDLRSKAISKLKEIENGVSNTQEETRVVEVPKPTITHEEVVNKEAPMTLALTPNNNKE